MLALVGRLGTLLLAFSLVLATASSCKKKPAGPHACTADSECEISCERAGDCCSRPYCEGAQHAEDAKYAREENKSCTTADRKDCPTVGARPEPSYNVVPRCKASVCVVEKVPK